MCTCTKNIQCVGPQQTTHHKRTVTLPHQAVLTFRQVMVGDKEPDSPTNNYTKMKNRSHIIRSVISQNLL